MIKTIAIAALSAALGLTIALAAIAQSGNTADVEIRVWERTSDPERNYISARPEGGDWRTLGTIAIPLAETTSSGSFRYGDITLSVPIELPEREAPGQAAFIEATCTYALEVREDAYFDDDSWWEFRGTVTQNLPFDMSPRLYIEVLREDGLRDELLTVRMDEQAPGRAVPWEHGGSWETDIDDLDLDSAYLVYVDDGYGDDRRIYLAPPLECLRVE